MRLNQFTVREIQPSDGPAISRLITEFDGDLTTRFLVDPYAAIVHGTENKTTGLVVEAEGCDGFVGMGTVRFSTVQYNGCLLPLAFLDGLKVRKDFRGNKLGHEIAGDASKRQGKSTEMSVLLPLVCYMITTHLMLLPENGAGISWSKA